MAVYHYIRLQAADMALPFKKRGKGSNKIANFDVCGEAAWQRLLVLHFCHLEETGLDECL